MEARQNKGPEEEEKDMEAWENKGFEEKKEERGGGRGVGGGEGVLRFSLLPPPRVLCFPLLPCSSPPPRVLCFVFLTSNLHI